MKWSKKGLAAASVGVTTVLVVRPHRILRGVAAGLRRTVETPDTPDPVAPVVPLQDEAHAPDHRHLDPPVQSPEPRSWVSWPRRADKLGHPGRFF